MDYRLTKFEKVRIIGQRAEQIASGAPPTVDITNLIDAVSIAEKEFNEKKIPFILNREFPQGIVKKYRLREMEY